jgi:hypothetical protein
MTNELAKAGELKMSCMAQALSSLVRGGNVPLSTNAQPKSLNDQTLALPTAALHQIPGNAS